MAVKGLMYTLLLFVFCFSAVHIIKLAVAGFFTFRKKEEAPPKTEKKSEPVYYIVEKKRPRKATYSEPKEIVFKKK